MELVRRWWAASVVVCAALVACRVEAAALLGLAAAGTAEGGRVTLELSAPTTATVRSVSTGPEAAIRLYVDLPPGTTLGEGVARASRGGGPVRSLRVGMGEDGRVRVVVDVARPVRYEVHPSRGGTRVAIDLAAPAPAPRAAARGRPVVVIDAGHGGKDPGAQGYAVEKEVTLDLARRLAERLRERLGARAVLTRPDDRTLPLPARTARANAEKADIFVSIHANASRNRRARGIETYYLNNTNDRGTIRLAAMENGLAPERPSGTGADLRYILSDLVQVGKMEESVALATAIQRSLIGMVRGSYPDAVDLGVKRGPFYVLVGAHMPCVLVETSFLTHPVEGPRLAQERYQEAVADGLYAGIARFLADARRARTL